MEFQSATYQRGELYVTSLPERLESLIDEANVYQPSEIVGDHELLELIKEHAVWSRQLTLTERQTMPMDKLIEQYGEAELAKLSNVRLEAVSVLTGYLEETQKRSLGHVRDQHL